MYLRDKNHLKETARKKERKKEMRKRLLAIVATLAMVLTMIPSVAFAGSDAVVDVTTADELIAVMEKASAKPCEYVNLTVNINSDIDMSKASKTWASGTLDANSGIQVVTINGNGNTITGLTAPLIGGTWAGKTGVVIKDLTIADSTIVLDENDSKGTVGVGAFIGYPQASSNNIVLDNCHLYNSTVKGGHWTGGLIGVAAGYAGPDGPVFMTVDIKNCSVKNSTIEGKGSAGGIIGHGAQNAWTEVNIEDTVVANNTIKSTGSSNIKAGSVVGTVGAAGTATVNGVTKNGSINVSADVYGNNVTSADENIDRIYGRFGSKGGTLNVTGGNYCDWENALTEGVPNENITGTSLNIDEEDTAFGCTKHVISGAVEATCTADGYTGDEVCDGCGKLFNKGSVIKATGHEYKDGVCACGAKEPAKDNTTTAPTEPTKPADSPQTGDDFNMAVPMALAGLAAIAMAATVVIRRKQSQK